MSLSEILYRIIIAPDDANNYSDTTVDYDGETVRIIQDGNTVVLNHNQIEQLHGGLLVYQKMKECE